jgi:hypothetical protein
MGGTAVWVCAGGAEEQLNTLKKDVSSYGKGAQGEERSGRGKQANYPWKKEVRVFLD